jgi:hypothetical protein
MVFNACRLFHRNHVIWRTKITKCWRNGNDSKQLSMYCYMMFFYINLSYLLSFFICGCQHHQRKTICLYVYISDIRQIVGYRTPVFIQRFMIKISLIFYLTTAINSCNNSEKNTPLLLKHFRQWKSSIEKAIRLFRFMWIPTTFRLFLVLTSEQIGRRLPVFTLTFDPQLKKILTFSVKDRYQLNYFICIKDFNADTNTSLKLNLFSFFICGSLKRHKSNGVFFCVHWHRKFNAD